jgi:hypothetical protein
VLTSVSPDPVILSLSAVTGAAVNCQAYFRATDPEYPYDRIPATEWVFESGVDNPDAIEIYERVRDLFRAIR